MSLGRDFKNRIGFVWSGRFRVALVSPAGRGVCLFTVAPGDPFGYAAPFSGGAFGDGVRLIADEPGMVLHGAAADIIDISARCPELARAFFAASGKRLIDYGVRLYELATLDIPTRLCAELLRLSAQGRWENGICILDPAPTHAALAIQICVAREAVSRQLKKLSRDGLVVTDRARIELHDVPRLREIVREKAGIPFSLDDRSEPS